MCYNKTYAPKTPAVGQIAVSRMGHDKGRLYAVVAVLSADFVLCADGKVRSTQNPKQKRYKHLKVLGTDEQLTRALAEGRLSDGLLQSVLLKFPVTDTLFI